MYVCKLPQEVQKYAEEVLDETEENRMKGFIEIKKWAAENPDLNIRSEEEYILPFLRFCKFNIRKTKEKIKNYYVMKKDLKEWYTTIDPRSTKAQELIKMGSYLILKRNSNTGLVGIIRGSVFDPNEYHLEELLKVGLMIATPIIFEDELSHIYGVTIVVDLANVSFGHIRQASFSVIRDSARILKNFFARPQRIVYVNFPKYLNVLLNVLKMFLPEKIRTRVITRSDGDLTDLFDKEILPVEYGGCGETIDEMTKACSDRVMDFADWFTENDEYKVK